MGKTAAIRVLHTAAECFPLVKTGGLADVVAALPKALRAAKLDARLLLLLRGCWWWIATTNWMIQSTFSFSAPQ